MNLSLQQFEEAMSKQQGHTVILCHYGSFNHSNVYEKFSMEVDELEYEFKDLIFDNPNLEMITSTLLKKDIKEITYCWFSNQIQLILCDGNRLSFDLMIEIEIDIKTT